jgi:hypothetical protein
MRKIALLAFLAVLSIFGPPERARAQSACPYIAFGAVLTAAQWNACFQNKLDFSGVAPCSTAGCTYTGPVTTNSQVISAGAQPGLSGCSAGTLLGGTTAGSFHSGTSGTCTVTLTFAITAPNGWSCWAQDTTHANTINQTANSPTTATFSGPTTTGDVIAWGCVGY